MSWIKVISDTGDLGYVLQCDNCGHIRYSLFRRDKKQNLKYTTCRLWKVQLFTNAELTPEGWSKRNFGDLGTASDYCVRCSSAMDKEIEYTMSIDRAGTSHVASR